ncbi:hypothetical protein LSTR_LSTR005388 [Laodelphax striatellus]|uniref:Farnesoic acid O-methyl transferase domain-containing protein n=1 Tax=Laodelphax striatellus TaxID=195883 RepID=A0A482WQV2_LAOST|nr:hypothetical protein LSTR_LSTR005388 [Laodelphax striatellus]
MDSRLFVWLLVILHSFVNLSSADPHDILQKALLNNSHELCLEKVSVAITTKPEYQFHEVSGESLQFKVRAANDAHIALTTGPAESKRMYEIIIGGWNNTESVIRKNGQMQKRVETKNILTDQKIMAFWIRWNGSVIAVSKQDEAEPFMRWEDPELPDNFITHYGISTGWHEKYVTGEYQFHKSGSGSMNHVSGESLQFKVKAADDAHIALTTEPAEIELMYEVVGAVEWGLGGGVGNANYQRPPEMAENARSPKTVAVYFQPYSNGLKYVSWGQ